MSDHPDTERMDHWNYRVRGLKAFTDVPGVEPVEEFDIIEVYYDHDGKPLAWGNTLGALGHSVNDLRADLTAMLDALDKPVLHDDDLPTTSTQEGTS